MPKLSPTVISTGLLGVGVAVWALATPTLIALPDAKFPLNPLGINTSPYGEVFAMAMQSPIDVYWHGAEDHHHDDDHVHDEHCDHDHSEEAAAKNARIAPAAPMHNRYRDFLSGLSKLPEKRTNPKPASTAHKFFMRRGVEDKLRFAYQLDPAHYANFTSYYFFLTQPQLGTRPELTHSAAKLAEETIQYCLKIENDPRPALTAAAAAGNILELMFIDQQNTQPKFPALLFLDQQITQPKFSVEQMRQNLTLLDHCIARYQLISRRWDATGNWNLLSNMRIEECRQRYYFIRKVREAAAATIARFEGNARPTQAAN